MKPIISIVIPIYKAESFLCLCVDSVCQQTYTNLEIILVDDGSPDGCPNICDQYAKTDPRVVVVHKKNGGVSSARNAGLAVTSGAYVCFVDSDDCLPVDAVEKLYEAAVCEKTPFVAGMCGFLEGDKVKNSIKKLQRIVITETPEALLSYIVEAGSYSPYAKLYDANLIRDNCLRFREDMRIAEDTVFLRKYLTFCDTMCLIPYVVYKYNTDNTNSLSKKAYEEYCWLYGEKMKTIAELVDILPMSQERKSEFLSERGINGITISINHYFDHWSDKDQRIAFIKETTKCLLPWVEEAYDQTLSKNSKWWRTHYRDFRNNRFERIYHRTVIERKIQAVRTKISRFINATAKDTLKRRS